MQESDGPKFDIRLLSPSLAPWAPQQPPARQIAVLMSGGVDSSVTAYLLQRAGWDVLGITMKIPVACNTDGASAGEVLPGGTRARGRGCCGADAAFVCNELNIPHYFVDVTEAFDHLIVRPFRAAYAQGQTPNPCVDCNTILKFSLVWDFLRREFGITRLATGHYAQVVQDGDRTCLRRAKDKDKDQSYFLYGIAGDRLPDFVLPLGILTKNQVRTTASDLGLFVADKTESMELCFAGEQDYRLALGENEAGRPGDITDMQGRKIGTHQGIANYTIGQRRGLGVAGGQPLYVGRIDALTNTVALGTREEVSIRVVRAAQRNTLLPKRLTSEAQLFGKIRSYGQARPCRLIDLAPDGMVVEFEQPQFAPCPGQRLVLYDEDENVVAGGVIQNESDSAPTKA
jgi:tRNA-specific 2-thiouridylase